MNSLILQDVEEQTAKEMSSIGVESSSGDVEETEELGSAIEAADHSDSETPCAWSAIRPSPLFLLKHYQS